MAKIKIAVAGCLGRMGQEISKQILQNKNLEFVGGFEHKKHKDINKPLNKVSSIHSAKLVTANAAQLIKNSNVIIDFTTPESTLDNLKIANKKFKSRLIVGTGKYRNMQECAKAISISAAPILYEAAKVCSHPINSDATNAPNNDPSPPTTTHTNTIDPSRNAMPGKVVSDGPAITPAKPAKPVPTPKTPINTNGTL